MAETQTETKDGGSLVGPATTNETPQTTPVQISTVNVNSNTAHYFNDTSQQNISIGTQVGNNSIHENLPNLHFSAETSR